MGMAVRPRRNWLLITGFAFLIVVGIASALVVQGARQQNERVAHTLEAQSAAKSLLIALIDAETGQRGFLLTGAEPYADRHEIGMANSGKTFDRLRELTADNPQQQARLAALRPVIAAKLDEMRETMTLARDGDFDAAVAAVRTDRGKKLMDDIRLRLAAVGDTEAQLLATRREASETIATWLLVLTFGGLAVAAVLAAAAVGRLRRDGEDLERAADEVRALNEGLETTVAQRTADLQLANDEIQRFAYIVSHDLRAPLVNIMGFTSELETVSKEVGRLHEEVKAKAPEMVTDATREAVEVDMVEAIGFIRSSTERMDRLIGSILKLSREGQRNLAPEPLDLAQLIETLAANMQHQLDEADGSVGVADLPEIVADRISVEQIFANLIDNAVKYRSAERKLRVRVTGHTSGRDVVIAVADNGRGIAPSDHSRVFDLFRRAGMQDQKGDGIGLASVRTLARRLGGTITLDSALGVGSTFTVTLPGEPDTSASKDPT